MATALKWFFLLVIVHLIVDIPLQSDAMARQKNPHALQLPPKAYNPNHGPLQTTWPYYMAAHAAMHSFSVWLLTGRPDLAALEFGLHFAIDTWKSAWKLSIHWDQAAHLVCKVLYALALAEIFRWGAPVAALVASCCTPWLWRGYSDGGW